MIKKLVSFACCLLPIGAGAVPVYPENVADRFVSADGDAWQAAADAGQTITINATQQYPIINGIRAEEGFDIKYNMYLGAVTDQGSANGNLYILDTVQNPFNIISRGDVSVGAILQVLDGRSLAFKSYGDTPVAFDLTVGSGGVNEGIKIGTNTAGMASIMMENIDALTVNGSIIAYGDFTVSANSVAAGLVNINAGNTTINTTGVVELDGLTVSGGGKTYVDAGTDITVDGVVQNSVGDMQFVAGGNISVADSFENKSAGDVDVATGDFMVGGVLSNESQTATMLLNVANLRVSGGSTSGYSLVNSGNFYATVKGHTYLEYGINLTDMLEGNVFSLDTGTLEFGTNADEQAWFNAFSNYLDNFSLAVRDGSLTVGKIQNGINADANINAGANMTVLAQNISAGSVYNNAESLVIKAADLDSGYAVTAPAASETVGNINISGVVVGETATTTDIVAAGNLVIAGAVTNNGKMTLNANSVNVADVVNYGAGSELTVSSLTERTGVVDIDGSVVNTGGVTTVWAKDVSIDGTVVNNSGVVTIRASDNADGPVKIGAIDAKGGVVNLNALAGAANVAGAFTVSNGAVNLGNSLNNLTVGGAVNVAGDVTATADTTTVSGDVNIAASGNSFLLSAGTITIGGNVDVTADDSVRSIVLNADEISVAGNVLVENRGMLTMTQNGASDLTIDKALMVNNGGQFSSDFGDISVASVSGNGKFLLQGESLVAKEGDINIAGNLYFDPTESVAGVSSGMIIRDTNSFALQTVGDGADIMIGAVSVGAANTLTLDSLDDISIGGGINNKGNINVDAVGQVGIEGNVTNKDVLAVTGAGIIMGDVINSGQLTVDGMSELVSLGNVYSSNSLNISTASNVFVGGAIEQSGGDMNIAAEKLQAGSLNVYGTGSKAVLDVATISINGNVSVAGDFVQGGNAGALNHFAGGFNATALSVIGDFIAEDMDTNYAIDNAVRVSGAINVADGLNVEIVAGSTIVANGLTNNGNLTLIAESGLNLADLVNNNGVLNLDSGNEAVTLSTFALNSGNVVFAGTGLDITGAFDIEGMLYQGYRGGMMDNDVNIKSAVYDISASNFAVNGINQIGKLTVNSSDVSVTGDIKAQDLRFAALPASNWMNVNVTGDVSGGVDFIGLEKMTVGGSYVFDKNSNINAAILKYATVGQDSTDVNYWSTVGFDDKDMVIFENAADGAAMINVAGTFTAGTNALDWADTPDGTLQSGEIGIDLRDIVNQGTAIWFVHADGGILNAGDLEKARNLKVRYCNADGSLCYDYLESIDSDNGADEDLPAYIAARKNDLYIVFDPRFGGPIEVFKLQPVVAADAMHTDGEFVSAGALDNLIASRLHDKKFYNRTPIEVIPLVFQDTNLQQAATELYNRMEYFSEVERTPEPISRFARLFQARELEQIAGGIVLNEHTAARSFEDRMFDEFIWNRNRRLKKAWLDVDYGMFYHNVQDGKHTDGNRFSISGGFDWQESNTLQLGLTGRISHTKSKVADTIDVTYNPEQEAIANVKVGVADTTIGLGAYMMNTISEKARLYANVFADIHVLDVDRTQNFVDVIDGDGAAFSIISEWGLMHDILNQYFVGNLYARAGYNFGFSVKEQAAGQDYMRLQSDGYMIFTPGYSLMAQKRIYPSAWFQFRPYASIGIEYDVLGAPDKVEYRFAMADLYTKYSVEISPLWANIGGGIEFLSANGVQVGVDYRYQYNSDIQLHNIKISGSYRF